MARTFLDNNTDRVSLASAVATATPVSMACWVKLASLPGLGNQYVFVSLSNSAVFNSYMFLYVNQFNNWGWQYRSPTNFLNNIHSAASTGAWVHLAMVFASNNSRTIYVNGSGVSDSTAGSSPTGINYTSVGALFSSSSWQWTSDADISDAAIWSVALGAADITDLYTNKKSPLLVQKSSLVMYDRLRDDPTIAYPNLTMSVSGTSEATHPPGIIYPQDYYRRLLARRAA